MSTAQPFPTRATAAAGGVRPWLPDSALVGAADDVMAEAVANWSAQWFAGDVVRPLRRLIPASEPPRPAASVRWLHLGPEVAMAVPEKSHLALAALMLNVTRSAARAGANDRPLLEALATRCVDDLARRLRAALSIDAAARWADEALLNARRGGGIWTCAIGVPAQAPLADLLFETDVLVRQVRRRLKPSRPPQLGRIATALSVQPVEVGAAMGRCTLPLGDVARLAPGDVLLLETPLDAAVPLTTGMRRDPAPGVRCRPELSADRLALRLVGAISSDSDEVCVP